VDEVDPGGPACSRDHAPPAAPEPTFKSLVIGRAVQEVDGIRLTLEVRAEGYRLPYQLFCAATVDNLGAEPVLYTAGGCGCPTLQPAVHDANGEGCRSPQPMCPCWSEQAELEPGRTAGGTLLQPLTGCRAEPSEAAVAFGFRAGPGGEWKHLEVHVAITVPDSLTAPAGQGESPGSGGV
jgi:hypothetical protein